MKLALLMALAAANARAPTVILPGFSISGVEPVMADALVDHFATELSAGGGLKVLTKGDVQQLLGLERQRQLLGCAAEGGSSCVAEIVAAMGADAIITGSVVKGDSRWTATLRVLDARNGNALASATGRFEKWEALEDWFDAQVSSVRSAVGAPSGPSAARVLPWVTLAVGAAALVTGAVLFAVSKADAATLRGVQLGSTVDVAATAQAGQLKESLGLALLIGGGAVALAGVLLAVLMPEAPVQVALSPRGLTVFARWP